MKLTKRAYEDELNDNSPHYDSDLWIIAGDLRVHYQIMNLYGSALRKYDPIAFNVGYNEWKREHSKKVTNKRPAKKLKGNS